MLALPTSVPVDSLSWLAGVLDLVDGFDAVVEPAYMAVVV